MYRQVVVIARDTAKLDFYVAGPMCTPFSPKGDRQGFQDHNSLTLIQFVKTMCALQPRVAILENVPGILQQKHRADLKKLLSVVKGYTLKIFTKVDSRNFGLPQSRVRVYFVFVKINTLDSSTKKCMAKLTSIMDATVVQRCPSFREFFIGAGEGLTPRTSSTIPVAGSCTCCADKVCRNHQCRCTSCANAGMQTKACKWRSHTAQYLRKTCRDRVIYRNKWRTVKGNPKLKHCPTYFQLAQRRGIHADSLITSPRERVMLESLSLSKNLMAEDVIIDLSQSIQRKTMRCDGIVPTLGTGCSRLLVTSAAQLLTARQCLWLQGMNPNDLDLTGMQDDDIYYMAGNAMCLPAIGTIIIACMCIMQW